MSPHEIQAASRRRFLKYLAVSPLFAQNALAEGLRPLDPADWAPRDLQGQIFTTAAGLKVGAFALGAAVAGPLVTGIGSSGAIIVSAGTNFVGAAVGWLLMRRA